MKRIPNLNGIWLAGLLALAAAPALAADGLSAHHAWVRAAPPMARMLAGYVTLKNSTDQPVRIVGAESPAFDAVEMHRSVIKNGVAHMIEQDSVTVPAHGDFGFAPGGYHLMLIHPKHALRVGDSVNMTLRLKDGRTVSFKMPVRKANGAAMPKHMQH